ncbi:hypothetical protein K1T71_012267 [Dendrolimus kikuchii]|uniref:Uncharacterized protein n=1 Tax=Dendrolimus kikuchii TaxID=765133 RepID=A0ACC1CL23_9NEOP|nr:hypothetical protein K1T71_012267 [Dendrolimus kikuchii]
MPSIAQRLCDEIVEPVLQTTSRISAVGNCTRLMHHCPSKQDGKPTRTIIVEKKKVVNKITPRDSNIGRTVIKQLKSKETFSKKKLTDIAVNTFITGPLKCDNECVTMVRRRDNRCSCKCAHKCMNTKASVKEIQTFDTMNYMHTDKACAQCVETVSCGTQFLEKLSRALSKGSKSGIKINKPFKATPRESFKIQHNSSNFLSNNSGFSNSSVKGARRWALSQYPTRGPDF